MAKYIQGKIMANYILDGHTPVKEPDLLKWAEWFEKANRTVKRSRIEVSITNERVGVSKKLGFIEVSTVFLGIDHSFTGGKPLLFETMVFGGELDQEMDRCSTWEAAEKMHEAMCYKVKSQTF
ncbi:hypothetical protein KAR91_24485 [Candidatus Pacearchaeota archaeon]|nr:hypothetical protein [Candidatus Pacearchaeota archaeon]